MKGNTNVDMGGVTEEGLMGDLEKVRREFTEFQVVGVIRKRTHAMVKEGKGFQEMSKEMGNIVTDCLLNGHTGIHFEHKSNSQVELS